MEVRARHLPRRRDPQGSLKQLVSHTRSRTCSGPAYPLEIEKRPFYWLAQVGGAVLAALFLLALFGNVDHLGATRPHYGTTSAFLMELALSCLLITVILNVATRLKVVGPNAALAAGGTVALCGLFAKPVSDASMNPARSLGPALVSGSLEQVWIYLAAPVLGALLAVLFMAILHGRRDPDEVEAATGDGS
ncbi:aquaporin [Thermithiobacillus tepidarius DSM 3134]|uniref:MIP/aquaporin family protein n=1 Tax=Thermithiobacillus tepidarius TaxID=929 RepID=UPI003AAE413A